jgi:hypothetical protein
MSLPIIFRPIARLELDEAMDWYRQQKEGLHAEFKDAVDQMLERIAAAPLRFGPVRGEVRRALLRRFAAPTRLAAARRRRKPSEGGSAFRISTVDRGPWAEDRGLWTVDCRLNYCPRKTLNS